MSCCQEGTEVGPFFDTYEQGGLELESLDSIEKLLILYQIQRSRIPLSHTKKHLRPLTLSFCVQCANYWDLLLGQWTLMLSWIFNAPREHMLVKIIGSLIFPSISVKSFEKETEVKDIKQRNCCLWLVCGLSLVSSLKGTAHVQLIRDQKEARCLTHQ